MYTLFCMSVCRSCFCKGFLNFCWSLFRCYENCTPTNYLSCPFFISGFFLLLDVVILVSCTKVFYLFRSGSARSRSRSAEAARVNGNGDHEAKNENSRSRYSFRRNCFEVMLFYNLESVFQWGLVLIVNLDKL